VRASATEIRHW